MVLYTLTLSDNAEKCGPVTEETFTEDELDEIRDYIQREINCGNRCGVVRKLANLFGVKISMSATITVEIDEIDTDVDRSSIEFQIECILHDHGAHGVHADLDYGR